MDAPDSDPRLMGVLRISRVVGCLSEEHDLRLVALAVAICAVACFTALNMLSRRDGAGRAAQTGWLVGAGLAFGCGVWTTHFVAMLAFWPPLPVGYEVATTTLSFAVSSVGALAALGVFATAPRRAAAVAPAGLLLGGSVGAMHFVGMDAMRFPGEVRFDPGLTAASVLLGAVLAVVGLGCGARLERLSRRIAGAACLALAILGLHLTAMAAVQIVPGAPGPHATADGEVVLASGPLAVAVAAVGGLILLSLFGSVVDQHLCARAAAEAARLRQLAGCSFEGIVIHSGGVVLDVNPAFCRLADRPAGELVGRHALDLVAPEDAIVVRRRLRTPTPEPAELSLLTRDGGRRRVEILSRPIEYDGRPAAVVAVRDLSDRRRAEEQIRRLAHHDALTGLPNRVLLNDRLAQALELAVPAGEGLAVLCLDLDRFKGVNDLLGHQGGDRLLVQVAERLRRAVRAMDTVARLGGDEFAVVQPLAAQPGAAAVLARRLVEILAEPFEIDGHQIAIGASVGIASHPADGASAAALLRRADIALYRAKRDGRGTFRFFEPAMDRRLRERRSVEQDLRRAIDLGQLELSFQPMVECRTGGTVGFEALARWNHPLRGRVSPGEFIPAAEECGLILPLGRWALEAACAEAASWSRPCRVAVNLSPAQFRHPDLPGLVAAALARAGLPADRLELEVTEGLLIDDADRAREVLAGLKRQGVRVSLDDFGSGYSSLGYLRRFPFDKVKIDRCFVQGLGRDREEEAIVRAILALARSLRLEVTAEGVETQEQFELLRAERCHLAQGYLLGHPMSKAGLRGYLETADPARHDEATRRVRLLNGPQPVVHRQALANYAVGAN